LFSLLAFGVAVCIKRLAPSLVVPMGAGPAASNLAAQAVSRAGLVAPPCWLSVMMPAVSGSLTKPNIECPMAPPSSYRRVYRRFAVVDFDPDKSDEVLAERGFDLAYVARIFPGFMLEREDTRRYNETRYQVIAELDDTIFFVVYTRRGSVCRLITAWEADPEDTAIWHDINS
jgi:uncharacterized DUF497 family protein